MFFIINIYAEKKELIILLVFIETTRLYKKENGKALGTSAPRLKKGLDTSVSYFDKFKIIGEVASFILPPTEEPSPQRMRKYTLPHCWGSFSYQALAISPISVDIIVVHCCFSGILCERKTAFFYGVLSVHLLIVN